MNPIVLQKVPSPFYDFMMENAFKKRLTQNIRRDNISQPNI